MCSSVRAQVIAKRDIPADSLVQNVDDFPYFKGGVIAWSRFLQYNLDLSLTVGAMDSVAYARYGSRQTAVLKFIVCEDGSICNIEIENPDKISPEFAKAVLSAMRKSPPWMPGQVKGKPVKTRFRQPVVAVIE
ncbi:energy transducer TonB [Sphingobacterium sp.]|uniref:energy transducer TonB n=1 Tax=Sphingobacterium sp. TaxID=341027 RepID=UPI00289D1CDF|nr:energy transducer TonB [Sphingobacterium sp.]